MKSLICFMFCLLGLSTVQAAPLVIGSGDSGRSLNDRIELLEDRDGTLRIDDLARPEIQQRFQPANGRASVGQSRHPWWIKLQLARAPQAPAHWWLEVGAVTLLDLQLYLPDGQGGWQQRQAGERVSYAAGRDYPYRRTLLHLPALDEQPTTIYLRSFDPAGNSFPLRLWQLDDLQQYAASENLVLGLIYGVIFALLLYNLFILVALRDPAYLWYVLATAAGLVFIMSMTGHGFEFLWPDNPVPVWFDRITLPSLWGLFVTRFTQVLLYTKQDRRWSHRFLTAGCGLYLVAIAVNALGFRPEAAWIIAIIPIATVPTALITATARWRQGFIPARFYLVGYGAVLSSTVVLLLRANGVVQPNNFTANLFPLAVAAEAILFSFALAYRIQILKQERSAALEQANREKIARLEQIQASAASLRHAVAERTAELAAANQRLCEREQELQHAAFHDPLTELANRRYLIERVETAMADARRREESLALMLIDLDHFKPINDRYGHDAGDLLLHTIGQRLREQVRSNDLVARLGGDEFAVLICGTDARRHTHEIAARLLAELAQPVPYHDHQLTVTISIGAALFPHHAEQFAGLYKAADEALYQVKQQGRSGFVMQGEAAAPDVLRTPDPAG